MSTWKQNRYKILFYGLVFIFMMIFFNVAHPIIIYNTDDWYNMGYMRRALPIWGYFNPIKVFPETLMPLIGDLGAFVIYPLIGDYIRSQAIASALTVCLFILLYTVLFDRLMQKQFGLSDYQSAFVTTIFLIFHFLFFKTQTYGNEYLFSAIDVTCYFNYTIPALLNASLVFYLMQHDLEAEARKEGEYGKKGIMLFVLYLALFSNLFESAILAVYIGIQLLFVLIENRKRKAKFMPLVKENAVSLSILGVWLVTLAFELSGRRAQDLSAKGFDLAGAVKAFMALMVQINKMFVLVAAIIVLTAFVVWLKKKDRDIFLIEIKTIVCFVLMVVYLVLLSAKTQASYAKRGDVFLSAGFFLLLAICAALAYVLQQLPKTAVLIPVVVFVLFTQSVNGSKTFRESNYQGMKWEQCKQISDLLLEEVVAADKMGQEEVVLTVPKGRETTANWPHATYMGSLMSDTLYRHGIISKPMEIQIVPDEKMNEQYRLPY